MEINGREYWDKRFTTDWMAFGGGAQTEVFARMLLDNLPARLLRELATQDLSVVDFGCAQGECAAMIKARFPGLDVKGVDFSAEAIRIASKAHTACRFEVADAIKDKVPCDIAVCSNVLEHLGAPEVLVRRLMENASRYVIVMVPFHECADSGIAEHVQRFTLDSFARQYGDFTLAYSKGIPPLRNHEKYWPYWQLLMVYAKGDVALGLVDAGDVSRATSQLGDVQYGFQESVLGRLDRLQTRIDGFETDRIMRLEGARDRLESEKAQLEAEKVQLTGATIRLESEKVHLEEAKDRLESEKAQLESEKVQLTGATIRLESEKVQLEEAKDRLESEKAQLEAEKVQLTGAKIRLESEKVQLEEAKDRLESEKAQLEAEKVQLTGAKSRLESEKVQLEAAKDRLESEKAELIGGQEFYINKSKNLEQKIQQLEEKSRRLEERVARYELAEDAVLRYTRSFTANNSASLINAVKHVRQQVLSGGIQGKKDFFKWFNAARKRANHPDARFNPFWDIYETARKTFEVSRRPDEPEQVARVAGDESAVPPRMPSYCKFDVLFFSVIDYAFRYQRPQQIADYYARNGHRVFYFNVNFGVGEKASVKLTHENLYEVTLNFKEPRNVYAFTFADVKKELESQLNAVLREHAVLDAIAISEYPNWVEAIEHVKHTYTLTDVLDYLDDWDGFENTATPELVANTRKIIGLSDCVIASSQFLADKASTRNRNVVLVRNGTEFAHFNRVFSDATKRTRKSRTVGYYGAIAHWFDVGKIKALAETLPDVEIELIGAVSTDVSPLQAFRNVRFLGEKPYRELPELIRDWDVCLIPFDTSTSLIKATNPVKFYEYLSAGKKVVATEIPEIEEFSGKYVLLANDDARFVAHVKSCLAGKDGLASSAERARFAHDNDWQCRLEAIDAAVVKSIPRFSIVVLTYGQLAYTKLCLASILKWTAYPNYELIVVDNASTDGTPAYLQELAEKHPQTRVILNKENMGFAAGNNVGLRAATGDYLLLLNNDTIISRGWLSRLLAHFRSHPDCGAVCPVTNSIGNEAEVPVHYRTIAEFCSEATGRSFDRAFQATDMPKAIAMFCFCMSAGARKKAGLLSEEYGRGMFEDDDYCNTLREKGFRLHCLEDVLVHHFHSVSFDALHDEEKQRVFERNRAIYERKWHSRWKMHSYRTGVAWDTNLATQNAFSRILNDGDGIISSAL